MSNSKVAFIRLNQFSAQVNEELEQALTEAEKEGVTGLIIDVRGNPGGLLQQAIAVASQFLTEGNVLQEADALGVRRGYQVKKGGLATDIPLVVLVDSGSASSSEIFAGAIQDHKRGHVIGEATFGTGTVLTPFTLSDGSVLLLGTSEWLTANGRRLRNQGIEPDILVELSADGQVLSPDDVVKLSEAELFQAGDAQLLKAINILQGCWNLPECKYFGKIE